MKELAISTRRRAARWAEFIAALPELRAEPKRFVVVLCSMRSGSTLLNALLAQAPDVSHLPEKRWTQYLRRMNRFDRRAEALSKRPIIVLKSPPWLTSTQRDGQIGELRLAENLKVIVLFRDAYGVVKSLQKLFRGEKDTEELIDYWCEAYQSISTALSLDRRFVHVVKYEDLVADPKTFTRELFRFIGSEQIEGVDTYSAPRRFKWSWGKSDASEKIKSLKVRASGRSAEEDTELASRLESDARVARIRSLFAYET